MNRTSKVAIVLLAAVLCLLLFANISSAVSPQEQQQIEAAAPVKAAVAPKKPRKLLVFNLCNGHKHSSIPYWDKALEAIGRKSGAYEAVISSDMSMFKPENLKRFDAVCLNNTTKLDFSDGQLRKALMDFVTGGKGLVGIHAASDNFYDWPEAAEMIGGQFTGHPWGGGGTWAVKIDDPEHPLTTAFGGRGFKIKDEIYRTEAPLYSRSKQRVLLSLDMTDEATRSVKNLKPGDDDTGISWVKSFGQGRAFYCSLGHDHAVTWNRAVLKHYLAGIQFALGDLKADTTPGVRRGLDELLAAIATYEYGQSRRLLSELDDLVRDAHDSPNELTQIEKRFVKFLRSNATDAAKQYICRKLSIIGTEASVPVLAKMLTEKATSEIEPSDMARYALERIPSPAADKVLRGALDRTSGSVKVGIINSLGNRGDEKAFRQLGALVGADDEGIAAAAISALGKIGSKKAADALGKAPDAASALHRTWADSYLMCADKLQAAGKVRLAVGMYRELYGREFPAMIRAGALRGMVRTNLGRSGKLVLRAIKGRDAVIKSAAIDLLREIPGTDAVMKAAAQMPKLSAAAQVQMLSALADRSDRGALPVVIETTKSGEMDVRVAAYGAVAALGDASQVDLLASAAASTEGAEQEAARKGLYRLRGTGVDEKVLAGIDQADSKVKVELIRSIGERNIVAGVKTLLKTAEDPEKETRIESLKVLRAVAKAEDLPVLIQLTISAPDKSQRSEAENTLVAVARKISDKDRQADSIIAALPSAKQVEARCSLLRVLGRIGGSGALGVLQKAWGDSDSEVRTTAVRALSEWPSAEPMNELWQAAKSSDDAILRVLALRGFVRLVGISDAMPEKKVGVYAKAMGLATGTDEKKMVLSGLANVRILPALQLAANYLDDTALQAEAEAAVVRIAEATGADHPQQTKAILTRVIQNSKNDSLRKRAQELINQLEKKD